MIRFEILIVGVLTVFSSATFAGESLVARGSYLANAVMFCAGCHNPRGSDGLPIPGRDLSGGLTFDTPSFTARAANITQDRETGIGDWSDDEIKHALTEGTRPQHGRLAGQPLATVMPTSFYKALTPRDLDAIVAYLRTIPPIRNEVVAPIYKAPQVREVYPDAEKKYTDEALRDPVIRGEYLVTLSHCMSCHSAWSKGVSDFEHGLGKGGRPFSSKVIIGLPQSWTSSVAKNITSDKEFGIGAWTDEEIKRAITHGISRDGRVLQLPMPYDYFANLSDDDLNAIVAYLRTVPPLQ